jgi:hypothetical protein
MQGAGTVSTSSASRRTPWSHTSAAQVSNSMRCLCLSTRPKTGNWASQTEPAPLSTRVQYLLRLFGPFNALTPVPH